MAWKIGQTVGTRSGHRHVTYRKMTVERVTKTGRAVIGHKQWDERGRAIGGGASLVSWTPDMEAAFQEQERKVTSRQAEANTAAKIAENRRRTIQDCVTFGVEYLRKGVSGPERAEDTADQVRLERCIEILNQWEKIDSLSLDGL